MFVNLWRSGKERKRKREKETLESREGDRWGLGEVGEKQESIYTGVALFETWFERATFQF